MAYFKWANEILVIAESCKSLAELKRKIKAYDKKEHTALNKRFDALMKSVCKKKN